MDFEQSLLGLKKEIDRGIKIYLDKLIKETKKIDPIVVGALSHVRSIILAGGKRIRPALMFYGYVAAGGKNRQEIIKTSVSIELIHNFLLIHDDVMDKGLKRHGVDTLNAKYSKIGKMIFPREDHVHFGNSMGLIIGDMVGALGSQIIFNSDFRSDVIMKALSKLASIVSLTAVGQVQDMYIEHRKRASEKDVMSVCENKTAKYTIEGPLHLGAVLGGADGNLLKSLSQYAIPVGIAFQIQDDILGIFGSEKKLGKSSESDILEGKQTILVVKAKERADKNQKKILESVLGNKDATKKDIETFKQVIIETGSLDYAKKKAHNLIVEGKGKLASIKISKESKEFLEGMADYMINREL